DALIIPAQTLMQRLAPRSFILAHSLMLQKGQAFNREQMRLKLTASAYRAVDLVSEHGEFAVRGAIMDIFPMGSPHPYRIDLFDDEIESIRVFDPETQLSSDRVDGIKLLPAQEIPLDETAINHFKDQFHTRFQVDPRSCPLYKDVASGLSSPGIEYYLPLFFSTTETILDYLPEDTLIFSYDIEASLNRHWDSAQVRYESLKYDIEKPILPPDTLLLPVNETNARLKHYPQVRLSEASLAAPAWRQSFQGTPLPDLAIEERGKDPLARLKSVIKDDSRRLLIVAESIGRREIIDETLMKHGIHCAVVDGWQDFVTSDTSPAITAFDLNRGLCLPDALVITEQALFGERVLQSRRRQTSQADNNAELIIRSLTELNLGSPVVHIDHGVGRYGGLKTLTIDDQPHEFLCLTYRDDDRLYVPVASLHLISRYAGTEEETAPLHRLGGETWIKARKKAAEKARDAAAELLDIYARREAKQGFSYASPDEEYTRFAADFPFEETPDQQKAIEEVIADMCRNKPMDRLICGDVGFGKTEVAMRAAFLAVQAGRQVAVLVPTTLLAQQHTETFRDRFAAWPVTVETLSRFRTQKEKQVTVKNAMDGRVDIIIGTHALIQDGLDFHNLGLLIIDEEHRFGVRQKERLKSLRAEVDILTLTATPIPRTLNMAISSMRDLSIISTPPARRLSIRTFVRQRQDGLVREAIQRELQRGGQVYYLHNEVRTIENTARKVEELIPEARVSVAHGQMRERDLEKVMSDFYHKRANVLVCTTIIETGIDIPNANTIIMDRADKLGLAQIHQLRGRVGRSHHQAYAYLLTPHARAMTRDAVKRLEAIQEAEQLGSGFVLATHDLEIRGAGELLGDEQTGHIQTIGFSLYMEMLENAVTAIREGKTPDLDKPLGTGSEVNMRIPALIPEDYLADVH
ncbi:MAG: transcription-repair coupling factor, partial [Gammaproteobacteria bacterium]|nr:transcription-repair coupling factor [Gammaproteobacteria bacterium]